jgi:hypothetical protein
LLKLSEKINKDQEWRSIRQQLRNESQSLLMKKKQLEKRLEANMLVRVAMREIANKQE